VNQNPLLRLIFLFLLIGACLDAHPNAIVSHELDALGLLKQGVSRTALFEAICEKSLAFYESGNEWSGYSYRIPHMWQGRSENLYLLGDKRGGMSVKHLHSNPELIEAVKKLAPEYRLIHVVRNPYDCIATSVIRQQNIQNRKFTEEDIMYKVDEFFQRALTIQSLIETEKKRIFTLRYEEFLSEPVVFLRELLVFLNLPVPDDYLEACIKIVWPNPRPSRHKMEQWSESIVNAIKNEIAKYEFFLGYTFS
jgi:hypothetical protein